MQNKTNNQWLVTHENHCRNSSWKQVELHNWDGIRNPLHRLDLFTPSLAINRLVAHFLFGNSLDYDDMRESTKTAPDSAIPANTRIRTLALTTVRDNIVQIRESEGGMASSLWGMYSRLPTLRVLTLRLRDVQFWLPIRNDRSWGRGIRTLRTPFLVDSFHRLISPI